MDALNRRRMLSWPHGRNGRKRWPRVESLRFRLIWTCSTGATGRGFLRLFRTSTKGSRIDGSFWSSWRRYGPISSDLYPGVMVPRLMGSLAVGALATVESLG